MLNETCSQPHYDVIFDKEMQVSLFRLLRLCSPANPLSGINQCVTRGELIADPRQLFRIDRIMSMVSATACLMMREQLPPIELIKAGELNQ